MFGLSEKKSRHLRFNYIPRRYDAEQEEMDAHKREIERHVKEGRVVQSTRRETYKLRKQLDSSGKRSFVKPLIFGIAMLAILYILELLLVYFQ